MNNIWTLFKIDLKTSYGFKSKGKGKSLLILGLASLGLIPLYLMIIKNISLMYDLFSSINQTTFFMQMGFIMSNVMILILSMTQVMNKFYFTSDIERLLVLPIKDRDILISKFLNIVVNQYILVIPIMLPFILNHGIKSNMGIIYYILGALLTLLLPIFPVALMSIFVIILMKISNIGARKELFRTVTSLIFIFGIIFIQISFQQKLGENLELTDDFLLMLTENSNILIQNYGKYFPVSKSASILLTEYNSLDALMSLATYIISNLFIFVVMIFVGEKIYVEGLISTGSSITIKENKNTSKKIKKYNSSKIYISLAKREIKTIVRTQVYLLNTIVSMLMMPIVLFLTLRTSGDGLKMITNYYAENNIAFLCILIMVQVGLNLGGIATTSFSREGKMFWLQKTLPIRTDDQIKGRILAAVIIQWIGLSAVMLTIFILAKMKIVDLLIAIIVGTIFLIPSTQLNLMVDSSNPKLEWSSPEEAMKQNTNVLLSMGVNIMYLAVIGISSYMLYKKISGYMLFIVLSILGIVFIKILMKPLGKKIEKLIED